MTVVERAEHKATLLKRAETLAEQIQVNKAEHEDLLNQRDGQCRELRRAGATIGELQEVLGISRSRVQQILRKSQR